MSTCSFCWVRRLVVALYKTKVCLRVIVKQVLECNMDCVLYDFCAIGNVKLKDNCLLHKKLLNFPAQAIEARMWVGSRRWKGMQSRPRLGWSRRGTCV